MPSCVLAHHCLYPNLDLRVGHKCRRCQKLVHVLCAEEDADADPSNNLTCFRCTIPPKVRLHTNERPYFSTAYAIEIHQPPSQHRSDPPPQPTVDHASKPPTAKGIPSKGKGSLSQQKADQPKRKTTSSKRNSKAKIPKDFMLDADNSKPDPLLMKAVAFDVDDNLHGSRLYEHFGGEEEAKKYLFTKNGKRMLIGTVIRLTKKKKSAQNHSSTIHYDIQWEDPNLSDTPVAVSLIVEAIALHKTISSTKNTQRVATRKTRNKDPFSPELRKLLLCVDETERGHPESSDEEDMNNADNQDDDAFLFTPHELFINEANEDLNEDLNVPTDFRWSTGNLAAPPDRSKRSTTYVHPTLTGHFATPIQSLLAFIPLKIFNSIAHYSNLYAHNVIATSENGTVSGRKWESDITINEIMKFFGILFKMVLRPTPGQSYPSCWNDTQWHPYTVFMPLRRFQQIRSVLHFNDNSNIDGSNDAAFKVRYKIVVSINFFIHSLTII